MANNDIRSLYRYLESRTIQHPIEGTIPFKLYPFQKEILKLIHENDRLLIIKGRQIGASTLLAGYYAWRFNRNGIIAVTNSINHVCAKEFHRKVQWFEPEVHKLYTDGYGLDAKLYIYDEWNFNQKCGKQYDHKRFFTPGKHIITGTVDSNKKLYRLYCELVGHTNQYKVVWFPVKSCKGLWTKRRMQNIKSILTEEQWRREMECKWD